MGPLALLGLCAPALGAASAGPLAGPLAGGGAVDARVVSAALEAGTRWLVEHQRPDGAWGSHHSPRPIEVLCGVPGSHDAFRVATTGLALCALLDSPADVPGKEQAIERGLDNLLAEYDVKRQSGMEHYNVWSFGYALQAFGELLRAHPEHPRREAILAACARLVEKLGVYQSVDGGWGYLSLWGYETYKPAATSMSFTTATILVGLARVRDAGVELPRALVDKATAAVRRSRTPLGWYTYGEYWNRSPAGGINLAAGSACRTPACDYALERFGDDVSEAAHERSLRNLLVTNARFQELGLRRPIPHESHYQISGYFYLYGHAYAGYVLEERPPAVRARYARALAERTLVCRQPDGSFWDYPLYSYHKPYGTAYALIALARALPDLQP